MFEELFKSILNLLAYLLVGYLGLLLVVFLFQRSLLYFPDNHRPSPGQLAAQNMAFWPSQGQYRGISTMSPVSNAIGTVVVFHGNAGAAHHRSYYLDALGKQHLNLVLAEYPGYGGRNGELTEQSFVEDGLETVKLAYQQFGPPLYLWGESLGAGVVSSIVTSSDTPIDGLVMFTPWDSLAEVAQSHYWYLPAKWLVKDNYDSVLNLQGFDGKVAVILATKDEIIPMKHGQALYDQLETDKKLWLMENAGHNTIPMEPHLQWWQQVVSFLTTPSP